MDAVIAISVQLKHAGPQHHLHQFTIVTKPGSCIQQYNVSQKLALNWATTLHNLGHFKIFTSDKVM